MQEQKISLLKIKLDFIINAECAGKKRFWIMVILGAVLTFTISGVGGFALIIDWYSSLSSDFINELLEPSETSFNLLL